MFYQIFIQISYYNLLLRDIFHVLRVIQIFDIFGVLVSHVYVIDGRWLGKTGKILRLDKSSSLSFSI